MNTKQLFITAAFLVAASSCSASGPSSDSAAPTTAPSTSTTSTSLAPVALNSRETGLELLDTYLAATNTATADIDLESPDADVLLDGVFADGSPTEYDILENTALAEFGLTGDDMVERFGAILPPTVCDFLARPVQTELEFKADEP